MPKVIGGLAALAALIAGILGHVDPLACVGRAALAFLLGWIAYQVWYVLFASRIPTHTLEFESRRSSSSEGSEGAP
ncbi:MAG: hypothetical protein HYR64_05395 [Fimbriimonas ginsengisoli]|uniref:Uncharacterized protein n=1 Tax=Fimbriimonas ginsengisoli TaxID=1005039 RepID=A0A931PTM5_FIMGI|nr:hypothetical protein [Fimbriimonas ginsengisoli]